MKDKSILFVHNRGYHASGPETYLINAKKIFEDNGNNCRIFCLDYYQNNLPDILQYVPKPLGNPKVYSYQDQKLSLLTKIKIAIFSIWDLRVFFALLRELKNKHYDLAIVLQYSGKLTPSVFTALSLYKVPTIARQSDYGLICMRNTFQDTTDAVCTLCVDQPNQSLRKKCGGSYFKTLFLFFLLRVNRAISPKERVSLMWTNQFAFNIASKSPLLKKFKHSLNYTFGFKDGPNECYSPEFLYDFIYFGRLSSDKGVDELLYFFSKNPSSKILLVGEISKKDVKAWQKYQACGNIRVLPKCNHDEIKNYIKMSKFCIICSKWFDNLPNTLIEAYAMSKPTIMPNIGSFEEFQVKDQLGFKDFSELQFSHDYAMGMSDREYSQIVSEVENKYNDCFRSDLHMDGYDSIMSNIDSKIY